MKHFLTLGLVFLIGSSQAFGAIEEVAPVLSDIRVASLGDGEIAKRDHRFPTETLLVGIEADISTGSACVDFVGQETAMDGRVPVIAVKGSSNPLMDACIDIMPAPVKTVITVPVKVFEMSHNRSGLHTAQVRIDGSLYTLYIDLVTGLVKVGC